MTIERRRSDRAIPLAGMLMVASIWFAGLALTATALRPEAVVAFGLPARTIPAIVGSEGYLLGAGRFYVTAKTGPSTVKALYASGAWLVWPLLARGCGL
jgi:hypothetical protein